MSPNNDNDSSSIACIETNLLTGKKLYLALAGLDTLLFIASLDMTIIATVYVEIANSFDALSRAEWTVTSYMLAVTATQPLYGKFSDILGRVEAIIVSVLLFVLGSVLCALSSSMSMLIASRAVQGLGGGGVISLIFVVVADILCERERGKYIGLFTGTWGLASAIAPVIGGAIVQKSNWRLIFWINLPICLVALLLVLAVMRLPRPQGSLGEKARKIDILGTLVFLAGTIPLLLALSWGGREYKWASPLVLGCLISGCLLLGVFVFVEWKVPREPIIPSRLLVVRNVSLSAIGHFFYGAAGYGPIVFIPQWALLVKGASAISAGMHLLPFTIGTVITSVAGGFVMVRTGRYRRLIILGAILLAVGNGLLVLLDEKSTTALQIGILFLSGLGAGACIQPIMMAAQAAVSGRDMAAVTTLCAFLRSLGAILCVAILSSIMHSVVREQLTRLAIKYPQYMVTLMRVGENQSIIYAKEVPEELRRMVVHVFMCAIRLAFYALLPFSMLLFLATVGFEHLELNRQRKKTIE
ncbi:MFS general substrate transporter [Martensiomyces pterosporus]|nr:MFS general substrate transporter [Martensiomyces pterosporus]